MINIVCKVFDDIDKVTEATKRGNLSALSKAAFSIFKEAQESIKVSGFASSAGSAPHSKAGQLKRSIKYSLDKENESAVIGPQFSLMGEAASAHEFGGTYHGEQYPQRPFMGPALQKNLDKIPTYWSGSITN